MKNKVIDELKQHFRPEFLNRVDDIIVFPQLTQDEIVAIVDLEIAKLDKRLKDKDMGIELTIEAKNVLAKKGYDPVLGARPLRRTIQREIEDVLSEKILYGELKAGELVLVGAEGEGKSGTFTFVGTPHPGSIELPVVRDGGGLARKTPGSARPGPHPRPRYAACVHHAAVTGRALRSGRGSVHRRRGRRWVPGRLTLERVPQSPCPAVPSSSGSSLRP